MTHDELLFKINEKHWKLFNFHSQDQSDEATDFRKSVQKNTAALRAVVELHKPKEEDGKLWCKHEVCYNHIEFLERDDCDCSYPCPTIQAIEKELK